MKVSWTKGLNKQAATEMRSDYVAAANLRKRLRALLEEDIDGSQKAARSKLLYDNPNWALLQADQRGYERALAEIISLIE